MKPEDDDQCAGCGKRYIPSEQEYHVETETGEARETSVKWYSMGSKQDTGKGAKFFFCINCCMNKRPLPIPFQCLFGAKSKWVT